ncbi:hypothetical protein M2227_003436 [Bradyrhizobium elkanii]|uniref:hypothetical protein n=1 Tax=Bradyrhizobium elkanii TaxID=29448 RepID=UPI0022261C21|nr:hypothetical protein [Bradyrhizobium elkanii]MCW2201346.1 hypothetical protein [Bradyrhizobium elkanii]
MAQATKQSTTKPLSSLFRDPVLRAAFEAAELDGLAPAAVIVDRPRDLDGGAVVRPELEMA